VDTLDLHLDDCTHLLFGLVSECWHNLREYLGELVSNLSGDNPSYDSKIGD
jgi:hypothetical protein